MFGKKPNPAEALYSDQNSRNGNYRHDYEYRTIVGFGQEQFDLALNEHASVGWELVGLHVNAGGPSTSFYATLRRPRTP